MLKIRVFSTDTCPYCVALKSFLQEKNIKFEELNVAENMEAQKEMVEKTGQLGVPVINVDGQIIIGFDKPKLSSLLNIK